MQNFRELVGTDNLQDSRAYINDSIKTVMSCSSGIAFPTVDVQRGMLCFRTDTDKLYQLKSTGPDVWTEIMDLTKTATNQEYVDAGLAGKSNTGHDHNADYYTKSEINTQMAGKSDTSHTHTSVAEWNGAVKWVNSVAPDPGVNDIGSADDDIWFEYTP